MKFVTFRHKNKVKVGLITKEERVFDVSRSVSENDGETNLKNGLLAAIAGGEVLISNVNDLLQRADNQFFIDKKEVEWLAPIPRPLKNIFCIGKNYADHAKELGSEKDIPTELIVFSKPPTTVIGQEEDILLPESVTDSLDYEGELGVVIGKEGKGISKEKAFDYVFGYTIINDVSARDLQSRHKQYLLGKSLDTSCPMGPYIVHKSELGDPSDLRIETRVNGEVRQSATTGDMIFDIPTIIETISAGTTLEPGDIIATGTPAGVGKGFKPPRFLKAGDVVEITIEGIGTLKNKVVVST
jgi:2-keto-4-pentenoate hydratase/2-oxohepta-3-ene-1,7-dioic acid hydratase in catechol pathway